MLRRRAHYILFNDVNKPFYDDSAINFYRLNLQSISSRDYKWWPKITAFLHPQKEKFSFIPKIFTTRGKKIFYHHHRIITWFCVCNTLVCSLRSMSKIKWKSCMSANKYHPGICMYWLIIIITCNPILKADKKKQV